MVAADKLAQCPNVSVPSKYLNMIAVDSLLKSSPLNFTEFPIGVIIIFIIVIQNVTLLCS